jgi:hypothetical protein
MRSPCDAPTVRVVRDAPNGLTDGGSGEAGCMKAIAIVLGLSIAGAGSAGAVLIPGGGPPRSDCYVEFDVEGGSPLGIRGVEAPTAIPRATSTGPATATAASTWRSA